MFEREDSAHCWLIGKTMTPCRISLNSRIARQENLYLSQMQYIINRKINPNPIQENLKLNSKCHRIYHS